MSDEAKNLLAHLLDLYYAGHPHQIACRCVACKCWEKCDAFNAPAYEELNTISEREQPKDKKI
jgi:hypothetical protein